MNWTGLVLESYRHIKISNLRNVIDFEKLPIYGATSNVT
jgi:hypothetical protein